MGDTSSRWGGGAWAPGGVEGPCGQLCAAATAFRPAAVGVGGSERGAPVSQSAYKRVCGAATPKPPVAIERVTSHGRPDAAQGVQPGLRGLDGETPSCDGLCGGRTRSKSNGFPAQRGCSVTGPRSCRRQDPRYLSSGSLASENGFTREPLSQAPQCR